MFGILLVLFSSYAYGIGVSPAKVTAPFKPGKEGGFVLEVFNIGASGETTARVYYEGALAKYVTTPNQTITIPPNVKLPLEVKYNIPPDVEIAGPQGFKVLIEEGAPKSGGMFAVTTGVIVVVQINIPYPGQYPEMRVSVPDVREGEDASITVSITNKGNQTISNARLELSVEDNDGKEVFSASESGITIASQKTTSVSKKVPSRNFKPGKYTAKAEFFYSGKTRKAEAVFHIGTRSINILDYTREIEQGKINKFEVKVENAWNEPIKGVYAVISVGDQSSKTPTLDLGSFSEGTLTGFIDAGNMGLGTRKGNIAVFAGDEKFDEKSIRVEVVEARPEEKAPEKEKPSSGGVPPAYLFFALGVLITVVIVLIADIIWLRKRKG